MKVIELVSENFKSLNAHVVMEGKNVTVEGKNGVGKSSFIDAIWIALTGKDVPGQPIQQGKDNAKIEVKVKSDDGSEFIVERKFLQTGVTLKVKTKDGAKFSSPQNFLDEKLGRISFDPFEFVHKQPREQKKFLMELLGIDLTGIDNAKKQLLADYNNLRKEKEKFEQEIGKMPLYQEGLEEKSTHEAIEKFNDLNLEIESIKNKKQEYLNIIGAIKNYKEAVKDIEKQLLIYQKKLSMEEKKLLEFGENPTFELPELNDLKSEMDNINSHNEKVKNNQLVKWMLKSFSYVIQALEEKNQEIKNLEKNRIDLITKANMPIEGLSFGEDGLIFDGLPFTEEQLSTSKLIEVGVKMSIALNPSMRIMRVKDASLLDNDTLSIIKQVAKNNDYQLFVERVSDSKEIGFIIEE